ncbi:hypothetical protein C8R45DRAFT_1078501 [Mycena sanguinolenta]|nr:hypothetical protein C8R45DRAFT_1078501 [Mycena sanguinolenta]
MTESSAPRAADSERGEFAVPAQLRLVFGEWRARKAQDVSYDASEENGVKINATPVHYDQDPATNTRLGPGMRQRRARAFFGAKFGIFDLSSYLAEDYFSLQSSQVRVGFECRRAWVAHTLSTWLDEASSHPQALSIACQVVSSSTLVFKTFQAAKLSLVLESCQAAYQAVKQDQALRGLPSASHICSSLKSLCFKLLQVYEISIKTHSSSSSPFLQVL